MIGIFLYYPTVLKQTDFLIYFNKFWKKKAMLKSKKKFINFFED